MLSDLSRTYLAHIDSITAGRRALKADIARVLSATRKELERTNGEFTPDLNEQNLELTVVSDSEDALKWYVLNLEWDVDVGWPVLTFKLGALAPQLFNQFFADLVMPQIQRDEVLSNPVVACVDAWRLATARLDAITDGSDFNSRHSSLMLLRAISRALVPEVTKLPKTSTWTPAGNTTSDEEGYPAYVEWIFSNGRHEVEWCLTFDPEFGVGGGPWLALVACDGRSWLEEVGVTMLTIEYHDDPVVEEFTPLLRAVLDGERSVDDVAVEISEACLRTYTETLDRKI